MWDTYTLLTVYIALLHCCNLSCGTATKFEIKCVKTLQTKIIKSIKHDARKAHNTHSYYELKLLKFDTVSNWINVCINITRNPYLLYFKVILKELMNKTVPLDIQHIISLYSIHHQYSSNVTFHLPRLFFFFYHIKCIST